MVVCISVSLLDSCRVSPSEFITLGFLDKRHAINRNSNFSRQHNLFYVRRCNTSSIFIIATGFSPTQEAIAS